MPANPKAVQVRIDGATASQIGGQRAHDLRIGVQPDYVASERTHLNRVLLKNATGSELRVLCEERRELRKEKARRAMKSNAAVGFSGIITFGHAAHGYFESLTADQQDEAYWKVAEAVAERLETSVHGVVVHLDETSNHAHFQLAGFTFSGRPVSEIAKRQALSDIQTIAAEVMQRYDPRIERGTSRMQRLAEGEDYADTVHKSGAEMRAKLSNDLPAIDAKLDRKRAEIDLLDTDIKALMEEIRIAAAKVQRNEELAEKARCKATEDEDKAAKALKNAKRYEGRAESARRAAAEAERKLAKLEENLSCMRDEEASLREELERVDGEVADRQIKLAELETATAQKKNEHRRFEEEESDLDCEIAELERRLIAAEQAANEAGSTPTEDIELAARLLFRDELGRTARLETVLAIMSEDPDWDISPILTDHLPEIANGSDPRAVMRAFREAAFETQSTIEHLLEAQPDIDQRIDETDRAVVMISDELHRREKTWEQIERGLKNWLVRPVADAIRATVGKLAELLRQERRAEQDKPKPDGASDNGGQKPSAAAKPISRPKGGFEPS